MHMWWWPGALSGASPSCAQYGNTALLAAAFGGSVEMARMLLDECGSTVNEVNNVSMVFTTLSPGTVEEVSVLCWQDKSVFHTLEPENPTFLMTAPVEKPSLNSYVCILDCSEWCMPIGMVHTYLCIYSPFVMWEAFKWCRAITLYWLVLYHWLVSTVSVPVWGCFNFLLIKQEGHNALHLAARHGHLEVVKYLLPIFGDRRFSVTRSGKTCLSLARRKGHQEVVRYLLEEGGFKNK